MDTKEDCQMKRVVLLVVALIFAFTMSAVAADKAAAPAAPADKVVATDKAPAADKKVDDKKPAKKAKKAPKKAKKAEKKAEEAAPAAPAAK